MFRLAILDDYQRVSRRLADWSGIEKYCSITVFDRNLRVPDEAAEALAPFDILCPMRERMPLPGALIGRLPRLKLIAVTGDRNRTLDLELATARGIVVSHTRPATHGAAELTWGLILSLARHISLEAASMQRGGWQNTIGITLHGRTLGLLGLGRLGRQVAGFGRAFGMRVIAWSHNLTEERAADCGATRVEKDELFRSSDVLSIHLVLGERTRGLVGARELGLMRPSAYLVNTSRGPIVDEAALIEALRARRIAGAALDVFEREPLADDHALRRLDNALLTPHLGYVTEETYRVFYGDAVENISAWHAGKPMRVLNPAVLREG